MLFHETSFPLSNGPEDSTDQSSCSNAVDLSGQNIILRYLEQVYAVKTCLTLFLHETTFPRSSGPEDFTDKIKFSMSIDLRDQNMVLKTYDRFMKETLFLILYVRRCPGMT